MRTKIGIPRALFSYLYFPFWYTFFSELGLEVIVSSSTSKQSLDFGVKEAVNDACLPIKLYHGHVVELKDKVDVLFLPRLVNVKGSGKETFCPKFLGLPDMIRNSIAGLPEIIDENIELVHDIFPLNKACHKIARRLDKSGFVVWRAINSGKKSQQAFMKYLAQGISADRAIDMMIAGKTLQLPEEKLSSADISLAVLGYPYLVYDSFINADLFARMQEMGVNLQTVEMVPPQCLKKQGKHLVKNLFWHFSNRTVRANLFYLTEHKVDGIVHVTAFGCGPDTMVNKLMELEAKDYERTPFMTLSLDEHTGEAGVATRVEAFVDMLRLRKNKGHVKNMNNWGNIWRDRDIWV